MKNEDDKDVEEIECFRTRLKAVSVHTKVRREKREVEQENNSTWIVIFNVTYLVYKDILLY